MRFFIPLLALLALIITLFGTGCSDNTTNVVVPPNAPAVPLLEVTTVTSDINHGTRVDVVVYNPTDQVIGGVILALEQSATRNADVTLWYGFDDKTIFKTVLVEPGQKYHPGLTVRRDNGGEWYWIDDAINGEDGLIIGDLAPHATVETRSWFIAF